MPTYVQKTTNSDLSPFAAFNKVMSVGTGTDAGVTVSGLNPGSPTTGGFITPADVPNSDQWEDSGTWTVEVEVDVTNMQVDARARCVRLNSSGTLLQSGAWTAAQGLDASPRTFSPVAPAWTNGEEACANRLAVELEFSATSGMNQSVTLGLGTAANEVVTDVTEDAGTCAATVRTLTASLQAVLEKQLSLAAFVDAGLAQQETRTGSADAALAGLRERSAELEAALLALRGLQSQLDAAHRGEVTGQSDLDAALGAGFSLGAALDSVLAGGRTASADSDAALLAALALSASADAALQAGQNRTTGLDAAVLRARAGVASLQAVLSRTRTGGADLDAACRATVQAALAIDGVLAALRSLSGELDAGLAARRLRTAEAEAGLAAIVLVTALLDAALQARESRLLGADAALAGGAYLSAGLDARIETPFTPAGSRTFAPTGTRDQVVTVGGRTFVVPAGNRKH